MPLIYLPLKRAHPNTVSVEKFRTARLVLLRATADEVIRSAKYMSCLGLFRKQLNFLELYFSYRH